MTVICNRVNLYDCLSKKHHYEGSDADDEGTLLHTGTPSPNLPHPNLPVASYSFDITPPGSAPTTAPLTVTVVRAQRHAFPSHTISTIHTRL